MQITYFSRQHRQQPEIQVVHGQKSCFPWARKLLSPCKFQIPPVEIRLRGWLVVTRCSFNLPLCSPWPSSLSHRLVLIIDGFAMVYPYYPLSTNLHHHEVCVPCAGLCWVDHFGISNESGKGRRAGFAPPRSQQLDFDERPGTRSVMQLLNKFEHLFALTCMSVSWPCSMCQTRKRNSSRCQHGIPTHCQ